VVAGVQIDFQTENIPQDLNEMIAEAHMVEKEMIEKDLLATEEAIVDQLQGLNEMIVEAHMVKKETIEKDLLATEEVIVDQLQDLNEMIAEAHMVKKVVKPLNSKKNLEVLKGNLSKNLQRNQLFNLSNFCH
jgi:hypothetical protein